MSDARKCLHCGGDLPDEEASHCSAECLINATHDTADKIVEEVTTSLSGLYENSSAWAPGDKYRWRFYEVEKRLEELEKMLIAHRRFTNFALAFLYAATLVIARFVLSLYGW